MQQYHAVPRSSATFDLSRIADPRNFFADRATRLRAIVCVACLGLAAFSTGCRGRAHEDVYRQKMLNEIRVLEDQLYEADYENRVLADKLERAQDRDASTTKSKTRLGTRLREKLEDAAGDDEDIMDRPASDVLDIDDVGTKSSPSESPNAFGSGVDDFDVGDINMGTVDDASDREQVPLFGDYNEYVPPAPPSEKNRTGSGVKPMGEADGDDPGFLLPVPGGPEPPTMDDTKIDPIIPGDVAPPSSDGVSPDAPPGQIKLKGLGLKLGEPEAVEIPEPDAPLPTKLQLNPGFSGRHRFPKPPPIVKDALVPVAENMTNNREGMMLVVNVLDQHDRMMELSGFDVDANMTVEAFDAKKTDQLLDTWKFDTREVRMMVRSNPVSGFHIPVRWSTPAAPTDNVTVKIRLEAGSDVMTCEGTLNVSKELSASRWTPRGDSKTKL